MISLSILREGRPSLALASALYFAITAALVHPLLPVFDRALPHDVGDPLFNTWILWWNARVVPFTEAWWNAPAFFPAKGVTAFSENLVGLSVIAAPVHWLSGNPVTAYNVAFFLSFALSGFAAYLLALELTRQQAAAVIAGIAFAFAPYRIAQLSHLQMLSSYWMPVALLALHRYLRDPRARWLALFAAGWLLQALCNGYYLFFFSVLLGLWLVWFVVLAGRWRALGAILLAWALAAAPLAPVFLQYRTIHQDFGFVRGIEEIRGYSPDVMSLLHAARELTLWGWMSYFPRPEGELFPGLTVVLLMAAGFVTVLRSPAQSSRTLRRVRLALAATTVVVVVIVASRLLLGPWRLDWFLFRVSVTKVHKPVTIALACGALLLALSPRAIRACKTRSPLAFYSCSAFIMWLLSLGPEPTLFGQPILYRPPYAWLMAVPGLNALRVPARFWMVAILCLSIAAALAYARVVRRRSQPVLGVVVCLAILAEGWVLRMPVVAVPQPVCPDGPSDATAALHLPLGQVDTDIRAMYRSMQRGPAAVNGYSGHFAPHYSLLQYGLAQKDGGLLSEFASFGDLEVIVDRSRDPDGSWRRYVQSHPTVQAEVDCGETTLFRIPARREQREDPPSGGASAPVRAIRASVDTEELMHVSDGDLVTRWQTGPQTQTSWIEVDLGAAWELDAVVISLGPYSADFPRRLLVEVSPDAATWARAWEGTTHREALRGAFSHPKELPIVVPMAQRRARYLRLTQNGFDPVYYWSIAELAAFGRRVESAAQVGSR